MAKTQEQRHSALEGLRDAYRTGRLILFAGAGVSAGLGLPTGPELAVEMAGHLEEDAQEFCNYGDVRALAEYYRLRRGLAPLHGWMCKEWHRPDIDIKGSELHRLIVHARFHSIYTTNFDRWLEAAHEAYGKPYIKVTSVRDLAALAESTARPIIKFHGDLDDPDSMVLAESAYFERLSFESPLDLKLRADLLVYPVLFVGYSISDINIRMLFWKLAKLWQQPLQASDRPPSYLFWHMDNPVASAVLAQWGIQVISSHESDPGKALLSFLRDLAEDGPIGRSRTVTT
ncbi:Sir2 family NAD-dependent protein deacetylase [Bordetella sp. H567]|uniref:SIR2 family protein n=1 Tax=Bordetella sp. H567 TaxID=1697043 RepID=UPI00081C52ED|nr:SIR2 family protein [Bordetella sp. H567]AOB30438.1 Sir2 family NAD-dependent protein deacetylase [Bordetella sp. H567]